MAEEWGVSLATIHAILGGRAWAEKDSPRA